jgi:hypothetical protein
VRRVHGSMEDAPSVSGSVVSLDWAGAVSAVSLVVDGGAASSRQHSAPAGTTRAARQRVP